MENYPESIQIVDFYHPIEHLCDFAKLYLKLIKKDIGGLIQYQK